MFNMHRPKKYKVIKVVKTMGEEAVLGDQAYRYLTADEMKSLGDDSLPIDVTRDERIDSNKMVTSTDSNFPPQHIEDSISPEHISKNYVEYIKKYSADNVDIARHPINIGFLVSFLVDARGGAMRGCRHSGVMVIVPPRCAPSPTRITCRYVRPQRTPHPPPLMEGEALASRILELGPVGAKFLGPVIIEVPHFAALRGREREIVILRSDNGESWKEHAVDATDEVLNKVLHDSFDAEDLNQMEDISSGRITRIVTQDFPQYFAVVSRVRQEVHAIGPEGGMVSSTVVPQVQAIFPEGALTKKIKVGLQAQPIDPELTAKLLGHGVAVSPVVTVEPRRRKFHKAIRLNMPAPTAHSQGMINQYSGAAPTLRLLCSITGGTTRAQWEDVTGSTPLTFVNDVVSFTTTVSARFWLMDCRNIGDATKMATELYKEAIHVPFMAKFVVFAKRVDPLEARLRAFCMTDDKEDKTLEHQEHFTEVAKSRDVEVLEGKPQYVEFAGNLVPITKTGEQLQFAFRAFRENRLPFSVRVKDQHAEALGRCLFMKEARVLKGEPPQHPICILNIVLPEDIVVDTISLTDSESSKRHMYLSEFHDFYRPDTRLSDMSNLLGEDWVELAHQLGLTESEINVIKSEYPESRAKQAQSMLRMWLSQSGNMAQTNTLENALRRIGREDIIPQCLNVDQPSYISRIKEEEIGYRLKKDADRDRKSRKDDEYELPDKKKLIEHYNKYSAEEKVFIKSESEEEDETFEKTVAERREAVQKRLSAERQIPASSQRREIVQEINDIKRQSIVEDTLEQVKQKGVDPTLIDVKPVTKKSVISETVEIKTTLPSDSTVFDNDMRNNKHVIPREVVETHKIITEKTEHKTQEDSRLLEGVTQSFEDSRTKAQFVGSEDPKSPKFSKTPPPSPADFLLQKETTPIREWDSRKAALSRQATPLDQVASEQDGPSSEFDVISSNRSLLSPLSSPPPPNNRVSYSEINDILEKMLKELNEVEKHEKLFGLDLDILEPDEQHCINTIELVPCSDALIEVPIKKSIRVPKKKTYETTQEISILESIDSNPYELMTFDNNHPPHVEDNSYDLIQFIESPISHENIAQANEVISIPVEEDEACLLLEHLEEDSYFEKPYVSHYKIEFNTLKTASSESLDDNLYDDLDIINNTKIDDDPVDCDYEPIHTQQLNDFNYQLHNENSDASGIWWEGTYRNLSVVPEEDEDELSQYSSNFMSKVYPPIADLRLTEERRPLIDSQKSSFASNSSSSFAESSSDEGDYVIPEKQIKAEVKLLVKTVDGGRENIEVRSVREFVDENKNNNQKDNHTKLKNKSRTLPSRLGEKIHSFGNKFSSFLDSNKKKSSSYHSLQVSEKADSLEPYKGETNKPSFILQRLFVRTPPDTCFEEENSNLSQNKELSRSRSELIATQAKKFPLEFDQQTYPNMQVDLFANTPFYPVYNEYQSKSSSKSIPCESSPKELQTSFLNSPYSQGYCDWVAQTEDSLKGSQPHESQQPAASSQVETEELQQEKLDDKNKKVAAADQHQLSDEMKQLLKEMEKEAKQ